MSDSKRKKDKYSALQKKLKRKHSFERYIRKIKLQEYAHRHDGGIG